jgi:probable rRNA maturation factor
MAISVMIDHRAWKKSRSIDRLARKATRAALEVAGVDLSRCNLAITFASDSRLASLNRKWRAQDKSTNVLSFPAPSRHADRFLGDIVLASGMIRREAKEQGKRLLDHTAHLIVHGVLHLLGHNHADASSARRMERMEVRALETLGIANPYHGS